MSRYFWEEMFGEDGKLERYLRLRFLKNIVRPARRLEKAEVVALAEWQLDALLATSFREVLKLAALKSCYQETSFGRMHYYDSAPGSSETPSVLLHGIGSSGQSFALLAAMLRQKRRIVAPDLFHFCGFSESKQTVMSITEHTTAISELIERVSPQPVDFCGLSMGGWIGMRLATTRPDLVRSLALLNPGGIRLGTLRLRETLLYLGWRKFQTLYPGVMCAFPFTGAPLLSEVCKRAVYRLLKQDAVHEFVRSVQHECFVDEIVHKIACPVLLLWGREDRLLSTQVPYFLVENIPHLRAFWVERCAHVLSLEAPANVYIALKEFWGMGEKEDSAFAKFVLSSSPLFPMTPISMPQAPSSEDRVDYGRGA